MLKWLKYLWGFYSDELDDITGLSERDIHHVQHSWSVVNKNKLSIGMEIFLRLFKGYPETKEFFKSFSTISDDELKNNADFKAHVINFMNGFDMIISELETTDVAIAICNKIGNAHGSRHVKPIHFEAAKKVLVEILTEDLKVNEATLESWQRFIVFMYDNILTELHKSEN